MHPTDGALLAMLDEWIDPLEQSQLERHVDGCEDCRQQMASLGSERLAVGALLQELEAPVPARFVDQIVRRARQRRSRRRELIAAAAAGLFLVSVAAATIRTGLLGHLVQRVRSPKAPVVAPARPVLPRPDEASTGVAIEATSDVRIEFAAAQTEGELRIVMGVRPQVTVTGSEPVPYALRRGKVMVANQGSRASYLVALPRDLERVAIRVAGRVVFAKWQSAIITEATRDSAGSYRVTLVEGGRAR